MLNTNNQNNILFKSMEMQQKLQDRRVFEQFLNQTEHVTCDKPRGHLVKENPIQQFGAMFTDTTKDAGNLGKALMTGKSNDHELGRMNSLGMKIGGGLIAAALMGARSTTNKKLMEVAGFATFFSAMSLWPKVAIDLPTKLRYDFNPHQKYIDSQGRKKEFFQDNQYLPWDVWSKEEINKVADKMNVPKDLKDREEYTKEKMRTIALQDNTLWMLTAGFASPLLTSLACNRIEEGLRVPVANNQLKGLAKKIGSMDELVERTVQNADLFSKEDKTVAEIVRQLRDGKVPENLEEQLAQVFDFTNLAGNNQVADNIRRNNTANARDFIAKILPQSTECVDDAFIEHLVGGRDTEDFKTVQNIFKQAYEQAGADGALKGKTSFADILENVSGIVISDDTLSSKPWARCLAGGFDEMDDELRAYAKTRGGYDRETLQKGADTLESLYKGSIKPVKAQMKIFGDQLRTLDGISGEKYNLTARGFLKALGFSDKELRVIKNTSTASGDDIQKLIASKISAIASDDKQYSKVYSKLLKLQGQIEEASTKGDSKTSIRKVFDSLTGAVSKTMSSAAEAMGSEGAINSTSIKSTLREGLTAQEIAGTRTNITSVDSMVTKLLSALELERKISDGSLLEDWAKYAERNNYKGNIQAMSKEEIENFYQLCRRVGWQSSYGDLMNKFHLNGNGGFYQTLSDTLFGGETDSDAVKDWCARARSMANEETYIANPALKVEWKNRIESELQRLKAAYAETSGMSLGDIEANTSLIKELEQKAKANLGVNETYLQEISRSHNLRFADFGESALNTLKKQAKQVYTDKAWLKVFGGMSILLIGATFISQLFFGKVKDAHLYEKETQKDTFESGK